MVYQEETNTCGNSCIRNVLNIITKSNRFSTYPIEHNLDSFTVIKKKLEENGLIYEGYKTNNLSSINSEKLPAIIQVYNGTKFHFVVLYSIKNKYAKIIDPQFGKIRIPIDKLKFISTGKILLLEKNYRIKNKNYNIQFISCFKRLQYLILSIIQVFSTYKFIDGFSMNNNYYFLYYGLISITTIIIHNILNYITRNKLNVIFDLFSKSSTNKNDLISLSKVLDNEVVIVSSTFSYLSSILICALLLSKSFIELLILVFPFIAYFLNIIITPIINNIKRENSYYEDIAFSHLKTDKNAFEKFINLAKKNSHIFLLLKLTPYFLLTIFNLIYLIANYYLNPNFSFSKFFFFIFISFFVYTLFDKLINTIKKKEISYSELNRMSLQIKSFYLKKKVIIYYNNNENKPNMERFNDG